MSVLDSLVDQFENAEVFVWDLRKPGRENVKQFIKRHNGENCFLREDSKTLELDKGIILSLNDRDYHQGELKVINSDSYFHFKPAYEKTKKLNYDSVREIIIFVRDDSGIREFHRYFN